MRSTRRWSCRVLAAEVAYSQCDDWLDAVLRQLGDNRAYLRNNLPDGITWTPPDGPA
jgi:bifunctional pyridoxal-dependent enzyme with beta-cystathionase and maltose regulon repressor activities